MPKSEKKARNISKSTSVRSPGPNIVRAWFDTVINPLLRALDRESSNLLRFQWTWSFRLETLQEIRPLADYVFYEARDNFYQFTDLNPEVKPCVEKHDEQVASLERACQRLQVALVDSSPLRRIYEDLTTLDSLRRVWILSRFQRIPIESTTSDQILTDLFGGFQPNEHVSVLAEYIINNTGQLPDHYTTAPLWNAYREPFMQALQAPSVRSEKREVGHIGAELLQTSKSLRNLLQQLRLRLSTLHDVPYVELRPVTQPKGPWD